MFKVPECFTTVNGQYDGGEQRQDLQPQIFM